MCKTDLFASAVVVMTGLILPAQGEVDWPADRGQPGDKMIQPYLQHEAMKLDAGFMEGIRSAEEWTSRRERYKQEYLYMLGLWPVPPKTNLNVTVTGSIEGEGFIVDMLHYQSRPGLYVTCNLYRPAAIAPGERLPAVLYVCGHWGQGRNGVKVGFQPHGMWYARHGYVCLIVDTLQLGEIAAIHHGTYKEQRWWWHSRGYTPAGVECWNGIRAIDYLTSRADVDPQRIAVTGMSGGGAASFWIAAADERVAVAVPASGMADLASYVGDRVINGHCDCMFLYNTFEWPWTRIATLVAPRPLMFVNSDTDRIFPMDANERIINRLERMYSLFGASDRVDAFVSVGDHAYRKDIRQAGYRFINTYLRNDARKVTDSEVDLVVTSANDSHYAIAPERLRVFPEDSDIPSDELNTTIDRHFVPLADVAAPSAGSLDSWKQGLLAELRRVSFRHLPERIPAARLSHRDNDGQLHLASEPGIEFCLRPTGELRPMNPARYVLIVADPQQPSGLSENVKRILQEGDVPYYCDPRGVGNTRWTRNNPPNYVERSHVLLGRTVDTGRVWDVVSAARYLAEQTEGRVPVMVLGEGTGAVLAAYAALWEPSIAEITMIEPPMSHMDAEAPQFLNVLRVCDIPEILGMLAPRRLAIMGEKHPSLEKVAAIYAAAGAKDMLVNQP